MVAFVASLYLALHGNGTSNTFTFDTDKIPEQYFSEGIPTPPHYGKLVYADQTITISFGPAAPFNCTTSLPGGNKITLTCDVPFPDTTVVVRFFDLRFQP
jgi:hypothetical protein